CCGIARDRCAAGVSSHAIRISGPDNIAGSSAAARCATAVGRCHLVSVPLRGYRGDNEIGADRAPARDVPWHLNGIGAIIFIHAYTMYVYVYLFVSAGLERYEASLDEAAIGLGAGTLRRLTRVTLPLLTPAIAGSALLVFMSALGSFSAPYVFGGGVRVLSTQILNSK